MSYGAFGLGCGCGCPCSGTYDVCVSANVYFDNTKSGTGLFLSIPTGLGNAAVCFRVGQFGPTMSKYLLLDGTTTSFPAATPVSGDLLQITAKRTGASCTSCSGTYCIDSFSSTLDSDWHKGGLATNNWATSGGIVNPNPSANSDTFIYRGIACTGISASYDLQFCINGSSVFSSTRTLTMGANGIIGGQLLYNQVGTLPPNPTAFGFDNFTLDVDP